jgi:hypothetical protein
MICLSCLRAEFIITEKDAEVVDKLVNLRPCKISNSDGVRYYWYNVERNGEKFVINTSVINFIVQKNSKKKVIAAAESPFSAGDDDLAISAIGEYNVNSRLTNIKCT